MKNTKKKILSSVARLTKKTSSLMANQACVFWQYDIKKPDSVKKLRKF